MVKMVNNANLIIREEISKESTKSDYYCVCNALYNNFRYDFARSFQALFNKLAIMLSRIFQISKPSNNAQSYNIVCIYALNDNQLKKDFSATKVNYFANISKHEIPDQINLDVKYVSSLFNDTINRISKQYKLPDLMNLKLKGIVHGSNDVNDSTKQNNNTKVTNHGKANNKKENKEKQKVMNEVNRVKRENQKINKQLQDVKNENKNLHKKISQNNASSDLKGVYLKAEIVKGLGVYQKGFINKVKMINFKLKLDYSVGKYKIKSIIGLVSGANKSIERINLSKQKLVSIDLPVEKFGHSITCTIILEYKISFLSTKTMKLTINKNL